MAISNYLNNLEDSGKVDGEPTNPCACGMHHGVTIVTEREKENVRVAKGSSIQSTTTGKKRKKGKNQFPRINLKCQQVE